MTVRIIDCETTGTDPATDEICEVASIDLKKIDGRFRAVNPLETLVKISKPMPAQASAVHHIIDADLMGAPSIEDALVPFVEHDDAELVFVAHNADFERSFLKPWLRSQRWICTYKVALRVLPDLPSHSNQFLRYHFGIINPLGIERDAINPHRAISDCYVTGAVFAKLLTLATFPQCSHGATRPRLNRASPSESTRASASTIPTCRTAISVGSSTKATWTPTRSSARNTGSIAEATRGTSN